MGWASYEEDNASRFHQATVIRNKEHDALLPAKDAPATKLKSFAIPQPRPLPVIVLADVSGSMSEDGKIDILNNALKSMILSFGAESKLRAEVQVGLITFGGEVAKEHLPLVAADRIAGVEAFRAQGRTPMGSAFEMARQLLEDKEKIPARAYRPVLVLVSDGGQRSSPKSKPLCIGHWGRRRPSHAGPVCQRPRKPRIRSRWCP
jgi:hypothetical protein